MTKVQFQEIMNGDSHLEQYKRNTALSGLIIISKYLPNSGVDAAEHDVIYACDVDDLLNAGITEKDAIELTNLNWMIDSEFDYLAKFV